MNTADYLVVVDVSRHGQTTSNLLPGYMGGREPDLEMTEAGIRQIEDLGDRYVLGGVFPDVIYTSTIQRAIVSGRILAKKLGIDERGIQMTAQLDEIDMGEWTGKRRSEVLVGGVLAEMQRLGRDFKGHGGESHYEVTVRVQDFLDGCVKAATRADRTDLFHVAAIAHFTTIRCLLNVIGAGGHQSPEARIYNGRTVRVCYRRDTQRWELHGFNLTDLALNA